MSKCIRCGKPHEEKTAKCEACKIKHRQWYKRTILLRRAHSIEYRREHREKMNEYDKKYRLIHREEILARKRMQTKEWKQLHPDQVRIQIHNRRARKLGNMGSYTKTQLKELFEKQEGRCYYCSKLLYSSFKNWPHIDHVTPLIRGGSNDISNIVYACADCNLTKNNKTREEFIAARSPLGV